MNWDSLIISAAGVSWGSALVAGTVYILGSSLFDAKQSAVDKKAVKQPSSRCFRRKPLVSIVILCENSQDTIVGCLRSFRHSAYRKYEIIVVDNDSKDNTAQVVKEYIKSNRRKNIRILTIKSPSYSQTLKVCLSESAAELILFSDAQSLFDKNGLKRAVNYIQVSGRCQWATDLRPHKEQSMAGLARSVNYSIFSLPSKKLKSFSPISEVVPGVLYNKHEVKSKVSNQESNGVGFKSIFRILASTILGALKISWVVLFAYLSYVALSHDYALPLCLFLLSVLLYSAIMISSDSSSSFKARAGTILTLPGGLILIYFSLILRGLEKIFSFVAETFLLPKILKKS